MKNKVFLTAFFFVVLYFLANFLSFLSGAEVSGISVRPDFDFYVFLFFSVFFFLTGFVFSALSNLSFYTFNFCDYHFSSLYKIIAFSYFILVLFYFSYGNLRFNVLNGVMGLFVEFFVVIALKFPVLYCLLRLMSGKKTKFHFVVVYYATLVVIIGSKMALFYPLVLSLFFYGRVLFLVFSIVALTSLGALIALNHSPDTVLDFMDYVSIGLNRFDAVRVFSIYYESSFRMRLEDMLYSLTPYCRSQDLCFNFHASVSSNVIRIDPLKAVYEPFFLAELYNFFGHYAVFFSFITGFFSVFLFSFFGVRFMGEKLPLLLVLNLMGPSSILTSGVMGSRNVIFIVLSNIFVFLIMVVLCRKKR